VLDLETGVVKRLSEPAEGWHPAALAYDPAGVLYVLAARRVRGLIVDTGEIFDLVCSTDGAGKCKAVCAAGESPKQCPWDESADLFLCGEAECPTFCTPGEKSVCTVDGKCKGEMTCLPDGSGFDECICTTYPID